MAGVGELERAVCRVEDREAGGHEAALSRLAAQETVEAGEDGGGDYDE